MKIVLATGIYPPDIGGPATYTEALAREFIALGHEVKVITYTHKQNPNATKDLCPVIRVPIGYPVLRWFAYAKALRTHAADADIVYAFSSISCGVPLRLSMLRKPRRVLRLGGDFLWERFTDSGGDLSLRNWYARRFRASWLMYFSLRGFHHIVFSTKFQMDLYYKFYRRLPTMSVIQNALPKATPVLHKKHDPFRILFLGRVVHFKHVHLLVDAMKHLKGVLLTIIGSGPLESSLRERVSHMDAAIEILPPVHGERKKEILQQADLFVLPSITEISPNAALEARAHGLPVLLTRETGLSSELTQGMVLSDLRTPEEIASAIETVRSNYDAIAMQSATPAKARSWSDVAEDHLHLFSELCT